jgi:hypothetical protein
MSSIYTYFNGKEITTGPLPNGGAYVEVPAECKDCNFWYNEYHKERAYPCCFNDRYFVWKGPGHWFIHSCKRK